MADDFGSGVLITWNDGADSLRFRFVSSYNYPRSANPTAYPVEEGPDISDHVDTPPGTFTFETIVSNTPMRDDDLGGVFEAIPLDVPIRGTVKAKKKIEPPKNIKFSPGLNVAGNIGTLIDLISKNDIDQPWVEFEDRTLRLFQNVLTFPTRFDFVRDVYTQLEKLCSTATLLTVYAPLQTYENAVITELDPKKGEHGAALSLSVSIKSLRIVKTITVPRPDPTQGRTLADKSKGVDAKKPIRGSELTRLTRGARGQAPTITVPTDD